MQKWLPIHQVSPVWRIGEVAGALVAFGPPAEFTSFKVSFDASVERAAGHVGSFGYLLQPACKTKLNPMAPLTLFCRYTSIRVIMNHA